VIDLSIDGKKIFGHKEDEFAQFDFEEFTLPPCLKKLLFLMKPFEIMHLSTTRKDKLGGFFQDTNYDIFKAD